MNREVSAKLDGPMMWCAKTFDIFISLALDLAGGGGQSPRTEMKSSPWVIWTP